MPTVSTMYNNQIPIHTNSRNTCIFERLNHENTAGSMTSRPFDIFSDSEKHQTRDRNRASKIKFYF